MLELKDVKKIYHTKEKVDVIALDNINLSFPIFFMSISILSLPNTE